MLRLKTATGVALGPQRGVREATLVPRDAPTPAPEGEGGIRELVMLPPPVGALGSAVVPDQPSETTASEGEFIRGRAA